MNTQQKDPSLCWMISLGQVKIPEQWHKQAEVIKPEPKIIDKIISRYTPQQMAKKLRRGIIALLRRNDIETRDEVYEILKERKFLPIIAGHKIMSETRFYYYYAQVRVAIGFNKHRETKQDFIRDHYKTWSIQSLADHIGSEKIYVQQTISKIRRGLIK